jgi:hypothetical protein
VIIANTLILAGIAKMPAFFACEIARAHLPISAHARVAGCFQ